VSLTANFLDSADRFSGRAAAHFDDTGLSRAADWTAGQYVAGQYVAGQHTVISGLRDSMTYRLAVQVYQSHSDLGTGGCPRCGAAAPCRPREHAATVIQAAGDDPRWYDTQMASGRHRHAGAVSVDDIAYAKQ
jgi:hypothetical protein